MRLKDKIAIVVGAGQAPGEGVGNGRATALLFAREGATVVAVDRSLEAAQATVDIITKEGGKATALSADVTSEETLKKMVADVVAKYGRIDVLHNNVGASIAAGDKPLADIEEAAFDNVIAVNLRGTIMTCKHVLPVMRKQQSGVIINISSLADREAHYPFVGYKAAKAGLTAFTKQIAISEARYGIRVNVICPGLMDTPMAVDTRARTSGRPRADVVAERNARVPLKGGMGTGWDVGYAALFLASDEAKFITGVDLLVDGGAGANVGL